MNQREQLSAHEGSGAGNRLWPQGVWGDTRAPLPAQTALAIPLLLSRQSKDLETTLSHTKLCPSQCDQAVQKIVLGTKRLLWQSESQGSPWANNCLLLVKTTLHHICCVRWPQCAAAPNPTPKIVKRISGANMRVLCLYWGDKMDSSWSLFSFMLTKRNKIHRVEKISRHKIWYLNKIA